MKSKNRKRIVFSGKQQVALETFFLDEPKFGEVQVETRVSLMSTGTENIVYNRAFDPGTHWDDWVKYPFYPGYASVGVVSHIGEGVSNFQVGDPVAYRVGHSSAANVEASQCYPIPESLSLEKAVWFSLAKIAFQGLLAAEYFVGDEILIVGAGPIGQMSVRWAYAAGVKSILVVDPMQERLGLARLGGATNLISKPIQEASQDIANALSGRMPRVIIDGTGNASVFSQALQIVATRGRVVILGDTGRPTQQALTKDVITRRISVVGAHDVHNTPQWNDATISDVFFSLAKSDRIRLSALTSHRFKPEKCSEAYAIANKERESTMGLLFDW